MYVYNLNNQNHLLSSIHAWSVKPESVSWLGGGGPGGMRAGVLMGRQQVTDQL